MGGHAVISSQTMRNLCALDCKCKLQRVSEDWHTQKNWSGQSDCTSMLRLPVARSCSAFSNHCFIASCDGGIFNPIKQRFRKRLSVHLVCRLHQLRPANTLMPTSAPRANPTNVKQANEEDFHISVESYTRVRLTVLLQAPEK